MVTWDHIVAIGFATTALAETPDIMSLPVPHPRPFFALRDLLPSRWKPSLRWLMATLKNHFLVSWEIASFRWKFAAVEGGVSTLTGSYDDVVTILGSDYGSLFEKQHFS